MTDLNNINEINLIELEPQEIREIKGGCTGVIPHDEEECPLHNPDNPFDDYIIIH